MCKIYGFNGIQSQAGINGFSQLASTITQMFVIINSLAENVAALATKVEQSTTTQSPTPRAGNLQRDSLYAEMKEFNERENEDSFWSLGELE